MTFLAHYRCPQCGREFGGGTIVGKCDCGSPLLAQYDLESVGRAFRKSDLEGRPPSLWRYSELLPADEPARAVTLGEGMTPILHFERLGERLGVGELLVKADGLIPTGTFKARGASVGVTRAMELGIGTLALASSGSAGSAWSAYGRRAGLDVVVVLQADSPVAYESECALAGARVVRARERGSQEVRRIISEGVVENGWYDVTAMAEPHRVEGKKTLGFEIAEQLHWDLPDFIVHPTGGGVGLIGMAKAFDELEGIGWIDRGRPRLVAAQSSVASPVVARLNGSGPEPGPKSPPAPTIASNLAVQRPIGLELVVDALRRTDGLALPVDDHDILRWIAAAARAEGWIMGPEGGAALAATAELTASGVMGEDTRVLIIDTSTSARYPDVVAAALSQPQHDPVELSRS